MNTWMTVTGVVLMLFTLQCIIQQRGVRIYGAELSESRSGND